MPLRLCKFVAITHGLIKLSALIGFYFNSWGALIRNRYEARSSGCAQKFSVPSSDTLRISQ